jgi:hypothetical protein
MMAAPPAAIEAAAPSLREFYQSIDTSMIAEAVKGDGELSRAFAMRDAKRNVLEGVGGCICDETDKSSLQALGVAWMDGSV